MSAAPVSKANVPRFAIGQSKKHPWSNFAACCEFIALPKTLEEFFACLRLCRKKLASYSPLTGFMREMFSCILGAGRGRQFPALRPCQVANGKIQSAGVGRQVRHSKISHACAMDSFPIFVKLGERPPLVVGGGELAAAKARL